MMKNLSLKDTVLVVWTMTAMIISCMPLLAYLWNGELVLTTDLTVACVISQIWVILFVYANVFTKKKNK